MAKYKQAFIRVQLFAEPESFAQDPLTNMFRPFEFGREVESGFA